MVEDTKKTKDEKEDKTPAKDLGSNRTSGEKKAGKPEVEMERKLSNFRVGDTVKVFWRIREEGKERIQPFEGIVIAMKGAGVSRTFTVRKIASQDVGVERIFPFHSPNVQKVQVVKAGKVRRAKLYYLRRKVGKKATRIRKRTATAEAKASIKKRE